MTRPYILFVGTIEPRKNLTGLLESFALLKSRKDISGAIGCCRHERLDAGKPGRVH